MSAILKGTTVNVYIAGNVKVKSVLVSTDGVAACVLHLHEGQDTSGVPALPVIGFAGGSTQLLFEGLPFPDGFTAEPDGNVDFFLIEYE